MIGDKSASAALLGLLKDEDPKIRKCTCCALGKINDPEAAAVLRQYSRDADGDVRLAAAHALHNIVQI
jgi:HEAT repeat protein